MQYRYQASLFADLTRIEATAPTTMAVMTALGERGISLLPATMQELAPPLMTPVTRLRFASEKNDAQISIASGRLDIVKELSPFEDVQLESLEEFADFVGRASDAVIGSHKIKGYRIALIVQSSHSYSEEQLRGAFPNLFLPPAFFAEPTPIEWTFRANNPRNLEIGGSTEECNAILKAERVQGKAGSPNGLLQSFDRIFSEVDINTSALETSARFGIAELLQFIPVAGEMIGQIQGDLIARIEKQ